MSKANRVHADKDGRPRCGRGEQYPVTSDETAVTCGMCLNLLAGVHGVGNRRADVRPCGTSAAYQRHRRREGIPVLCRTCLQGERRRGTDRYAPKSAGQYGRAA